MNWKQLRDLPPLYPSYAPDIFLINKNYVQQTPTLPGEQFTVITFATHIGIPFLDVKFYGTASIHSQLLDMKTTLLETLRGMSFQFNALGLTA